MSSNPLFLVGMAKKAGKLEIGEEPVGNAARAGQAKLIIVASDAADNTARRATHFADTGHVKCLAVPFTKADLGGILGRTSCAMAAFTDTGFAAALVSKLALTDPEQYGDAAAQLDVKAQRVLQRQKEQRAHEKNVREGKKKPWAPAPQGPAKGPAANAAEPRANSLRSGDKLEAKGSPQGGTPCGDGQRAHEKNVREGKKKPWAATPTKKSPVGRDDTPRRPAPATPVGHDAPSPRPARPKGKITIKKK